MSGPGQVLANTLMEIEYALPLLEKNPQVAIAGLNALRNELREGLAELKEYVAELQPPLLQDMGLGASIQLYVKKFGDRTGIRADCRGCEQFHERYPATIEIALFRVLQEALANVAAHAQATAVRVELLRGANQLRMSIQDNGRGFALRTQGSSKKRQLGLIAMRDRVELLGGQMQLFSEAGRGVRVLVNIPYHGHAAESHTAEGEKNERRNLNYTRAAGAHQGDTRQEKTKSGANHRRKAGAAKKETAPKRVSRKPDGD
ncbi:MAG: sensor histidine kinase [Chloroflexi bacterium]|nr:sensor histidine kinase [Chloroflexota bacterium]